MTVCKQCTPIKLIPECSTNLSVGTISDFVEPIYIFVKNLTTGYTHRSATTSGAAGQVDLDLSEPRKDFYNEDSSYELWVTKQSDKSINTNLGVTVGAILYAAACFNLDFLKVVDETNEPIAYADIDMEVDV